MNTSDYEWLRARPRVTTNNYKATTSQAKVTVTAIGNNLRHKNGSYDYTTMNVVNAMKSVLKIFVLHFWWKSLKSTCNAEDVLQK